MRATVRALNLYIESVPVCAVNWSSQHVLKLGMQTEQFLSLISILMSGNIYANRCWPICTIKTTITALEERHIRVWMMSFLDAGLSGKTSVFAPRPQLGHDCFNNFLKNWIYSFEKHLLHRHDILLMWMMWDRKAEKRGWRNNNKQYNDLIQLDKREESNSHKWPLEQLIYIYINTHTYKVLYVIYMRRARDLQLYWHVMDLHWIELRMYLEAADPHAHIRCKFPPQLMHKQGFMNLHVKTLKCASFFRNYFSHCTEALACFDLGPKHNYEMGAFIYWQCSVPLNVQKEMTIIA